MQKDKDLKHCAKATQEFPKAQKRNIFQWPIQSTDLTGTEHAFTEVTEDNSDGRKTHSQAASEGNCSKGLEEHFKGGKSIYWCQGPLCLQPSKGFLPQSLKQSLYAHLW